MQNGHKWNRDGTLQDDFYYFVERRRPGVPGGNYSLKYLSFSFEFVTFFNEATNLLKITPASNSCHSLSTSVPTTVL